MDNDNMDEKTTQQSTDVAEAVQTDAAPTTEPMADEGTASAPTSGDDGESTVETEFTTMESTDTEKTAEPDHVEIVAIPYINDGPNNVQLFYSSIFRDEDGVKAMYVAERYFFECFTADNEPKWDGVLVCPFNFTKNEAIGDERNGVIRLRDFKVKWLRQSSGANDVVTFNVKCTMKKVWATHFQSFLKEMENYGNRGHSGQLSFMADGNGDFHPKFTFTREYDVVAGIPSSQIAKKAEQMFDAG